MRQCQAEYLARQIAERKAAVPHSLSPRGNTDEMDESERERRIRLMQQRAAAGLPLFTAERPGRRAE